MYSCKNSNSIVHDFSRGSGKKKVFNRFNGFFCLCGQLELNKKLKNFIYIFVFIFISCGISFSQEENPQKLQVGIEEKLGSVINSDISLTDESGNLVKLKNYITKPTILSLVYFRCPGICSPLLSGVAGVMSKLDLEPGKDYNVITISFDPSEDFKMAAEKKKNYIRTIKDKQIPEDSWKFFTADSLNIAKITDEVGFRYLKKDNDFVHSAVLTVLSPEGKIARYLYGTDFLSFDMKMALMEASEGKVGSTIAKVMKLCYSYDPEGRRYALNLTRIAGGGVIFFLLGFAFFLRAMRKKDLKKQNLNNLNQDK
jgi:protein SCO1